MKTVNSEKSDYEIKSSIFKAPDQSQQIFINQTNNLFILAKYGQTVNLPCVIYKEKNQDLTNVKF
jgi:hypothetical protein